MTDQTAGRRPSLVRGGDGEVMFDWSKLEALEFEHATGQAEEVKRDLDQARRADELSSCLDDDPRARAGLEMSRRGGAK